MLLFGLLGYFWRTYDWPRIPLVIAFVLGNVIEKNLALTTQLVSVGRIDTLKSVAAVGVVFMAMVIMGWRWVLQSRRIAQDEAPPRGIGLGCLALAASLVMLVQALADRETYSSFATAVAGSTVLLTACMVWLEARRLLRANGPDRRWLADLRCAHGHRPGFAWVACLLPGVGLLGLGPAVGLGVGWWIALGKAAPRSRAVVLLFLLAGLLAGGALHVALSRWAGIELEPGWLFQIFNERT